MEKIPEHIELIQNTFHDESYYGKPQPTNITDSLKIHFIRLLETEIFKIKGNINTLNTILFLKDGIHYCFRKNDGEIFNITENKRLKVKEIESLFNISLRYLNYVTPGGITIEESKIIMSELFHLDIPITLIEDEIPIEDLKNIYSDLSYNNIIIAPLGTKKTLNTIAALKELKHKFIYLVPTNPLMIQVSDNQDFKLPKIYGDTNCDEIIQGLDKNPGIITSFTGFEKINNCLNNKWDYVLVFDEIHTLVWHSNFRDIIRKVARNIWDYKKIIGLTGTPFGSITECESYKFYRFEFKHRPPQKFNYQIIPHKLPDKERKIKFIDYILHYTKDVRGKVIIFYNNKEELGNIRTALIKYNNKKENEIIILQSDKENGNNRNEKKFPSRFDKDIKIILTTSIIASGVNLLDKDYDSILIFDISNFFEVFQLIGRPRENKTIINVLDFVPGLNNSEIINYSDLLSDRIRLFKDTEYVFNNLNAIGYQDEIYKNYSNQKIIDNQINKISILYWDNDRINTDLELVYNSVMEEVGKFSSEYPEIRKWIFEQLGVNATIEEFQEVPAFADRTTIKDEQKKNEREDFISVLNLVINNPDEVITYCNSEKLINANIIPDPKYKLLESEEFIGQYKQVLHTHKGIINLFLFLSQICGMPKNDAAIFIRANQESENKLINACKFIGFTNINAGEINNEDSYFAQKFDTFVERNASKLFEIKDLQKQIKMYEKDSVLAKYYSTWPMIKLNGIYRFELKRTIKSKTNDAGTKYEITHQAYTKKINGIINHYKLGKEFEEPKGRAKRALSRFIQKIISYDVEISS